MKDTKKNTFTTKECFKYSTIIMMSVTIIMVIFFSIMIQEIKIKPILLSLGTGFLLSIIMGMLISYEEKKERDTKNKK